MASVTSEPGGRKRIDLVWQGKRPKLRLGKCSRKDADHICRKVEALVSAKLLGQSPDAETSAWLAGVEGKLRDRLAALDLAESVKRNEHTVGDLMAEFFQNLTVKPHTLRNYRQVERRLLNGLGADRHLAGIGTHDADKWRQAVIASGLAPATYNKHSKTARQMFARAVRWKWIADNPFAHIKGGTQANPARQRFIPTVDVDKVIAACPDAQWRLIVALSRYAGLRCPSEVLRLTWADVLWDQERFIVHAVKTEHHADGGVRVVPIFPELRPYLLEVFDEAEPGEARVITCYPTNTPNLRTQLVRIIKRAGLVPWPKAFHNMRATRQTELVRNHPSHVVSAWMGNTQAVAERHYLQVTDEDFERATKAAQKAAQYRAESTGIARQTSGMAQQESPIIPGFAAKCCSVQDFRIPPRGVEPLFQP